MTDADGSPRQARAAIPADPAVVARSKRLSDFLDVLSDDRLPVNAKLVALWRMWVSEKKPSART